MKKLLILLGVVLLLACAAGLASAQSGYRLSWWTVDGGGGRLSSGRYALQGTAGQPDAGPPLSSQSYTLTGGFSSGAPALPPVSDYHVFLPIILK